jgi:hypothetical protein
MRRQVRMAALAVSFVLALGTLTVAQDRDDDHYRGNAEQTRQYGYDHGFRDGQRKGHEEGRENDPFDYRTPDWRQARHGYKSWMGPASAFQSGYQRGYRDGFQSGFASARPGRWGDGDRDRDDHYRGSGFYGSADSSRVAYDTGYQDGITMAGEDLYKNKPFNPSPRARFDHRDHGYYRGYGEKEAYKAEYTDGYRAGYQSAFERRY